MSELQNVEECTVCGIRRSNGNFYTHFHYLKYLRGQGPLEYTHPDRVKEISCRYAAAAKDKKGCINTGSDIKPFVKEEEPVYNKEIHEMVSKYDSDNPLPEENYFLKMAEELKNKKTES